MSQIPITYFLLGPTAVGKTEIAVEIASRLGCEIISADSMQLYRGMDIGTAKPGIDERGGVAHHLFDVLEISEHCDVSRFRDLATAAMEDVVGRGRSPLIVGGSGMYIRVLTQGLFEGAGRDPEIREVLEKLETSALRERLESVDRPAFLRIEANDRRRIIRALEYQEATGEAISTRQTQWGQQCSPEGNRRLIGLLRPREDLYRRAEARIDLMFKRGWLEEVRGLLPKGLAKSMTASKAIGYPEVMRLLAGELKADEAKDLIKIKTRQFIKRQLSWFRKEPAIEWFHLSEGDDAATIATLICAHRGVSTMSAEPST